MTLWHRGRFYVWFPYLFVSFMAGALVATILLNFV